MHRLCASAWILPDITVFVVGGICVVNVSSDVVLVDFSLFLKLEAN